MSRPGPNRRCASCAFYDEHQADHGVCRRYAPRPIINENTPDDCPEAWFPGVAADVDWCGEWQESFITRQ